jgi:hypothetical protein
MTTFDQVGSIENSSGMSLEQIHNNIHASASPCQGHFAYPASAAFDPLLLVKASHPMIPFKTFTFLFLTRIGYWQLVAPRKCGPGLVTLGRDLPE